MSKPEIVCKVGSGILAPILIVITYSTAGGAIALILLHWFNIPRVPGWAVLVSAGLFLICMPIVWGCVYRWLFDRCRKWRHE